MKAFPLETLLRLRRWALGEALGATGIAMGDVRAEERERDRLRRLAESLRSGASGTSTAGSTGDLQQEALFRMRLRNEARAVRERMEIQELRLRRAEAAALSAARALARARADDEALRGRRDRWLDERRAEREAAEEQEADDQSCARSGPRP